MKTAKLFSNGRSQAVRLPKDFRFDGNEVYIKKIAGGVLLIPKDMTVWDIWEQNLMKYEEPFMVERNQPEPQERAGLGEVFD
jgi:antitoxin VapB